MRPRLVVALALLVGTLVFAGASGAGAVRVLDRATQDRPDEAIGPQIHLVYALPSDAADAALDTNGTIGGWIAGFNAWLAQQSGGAQLRFDTFEGAPDITEIRLPEATAQLASSAEGAYVAVHNDLVAANLVTSPKIDLVVLAAGSGNLCGLGGGNLAVLFSAACGGVDWSWVVGHELFHTLGAVPTCAPHYDGTGHVNDSSSDLMWPYAPQPGATPTLDPGHDDYWGPPGDDHIPGGCVNVADSDYLTTHPFFRLIVQSGENGVAYVAAAEGAVEEQCDPETPCTEDVRAGSSFTLTAAANAGYRFAGWTGASCAEETCTISVAASQTVTAQFVALPELEVVVRGKGRVAAAGSTCSARCSLTVPYEERFTLRATPAKGWRFVRWSGACAGTGPRCSAEVEADAAETATFARIPLCAKGKRPTAARPCRRR